MASDNERPAKRARPEHSASDGMPSQNERPTQRARLEYTEGIEVLVGETEIKFMVHKHVVTKHSPFFRAALHHDCKEREEQRVRLPECRAETFNHYLRWIYSSTMETCKNLDSETPNGIHRLVELFVLGDRLQDIKLCNAVTDELRRHLWWDNHIPLPDTFNLA